MPKDQASWQGGLLSGGRFVRNRPFATCSADQYHQTQSPYIEGGVAEDATWFTNTV
jgi:hypothetical protein